MAFALNGDILDFSFLLVSEYSTHAKIGMPNMLLSYEHNIS